MRNFHLGDILSIITDKMVSPRHMEGIYDILNYMTDDDLNTHQIPRAMEECRPFLLKQYPNLKNVSTEALQKISWKEWIDKQIEIYGEMLTVKPLPKDAHQVIDPIIEAKLIREDVKEIH